jgi:hypothetical protein
MQKIDFIGNKIGALKVVDKGIIETSIIQVVDEFRPQGPAENSILLLTKRRGGVTTASYIPWVGYFDLDRENLKFGNKWRIIEPPLVVKYRSIIWKPFNSES